MSDFGVVIPPDKGDANYGEGFPIRQAPARPMTDPGVVTPDKNAEECGAEYRGALPGGDVIDTCTLDSTHEMHVGKALRWWSPVCAPEPPRVPRPAPGTPQRGSVDGDSSEALRQALHDEISGQWFSLSSDVGGQISSADALDIAQSLLPLVVAYGDQRAAEALREAADQIAAAHVDARGAYWTGITRACDDLHTRARQLRRRNT